MTTQTSLTDLELRTAAHVLVSNFIMPNPLSMKASIEANQRIDDAMTRRVTNENAATNNAKANLNKGNSRD